MPPSKPKEKAEPAKSTKGQKKYYDLNPADRKKFAERLAYIAYNTALKGVGTQEKVLQNIAKVIQGVSVVRDDGSYDWSNSDELAAEFMRQFKTKSGEEFADAIKGDVGSWFFGLGDIEDAVLNAFGLPREAPVLPLPPLAGVLGIKVPSLGPLSEQQSHAGKGNYNKPNFEAYGPGGSIPAWGKGFDTFMNDSGSASGEGDWFIQEPPVGGLRGDGKVLTYDRPEMYTHGGVKEAEATTATTPDPKVTPPDPKVTPAPDPQGGTVVPKPNDPLTTPILTGPIPPKKEPTLSPEAQKEMSKSPRRLIDELRRGGYGQQGQTGAKGVPGPAGRGDPAKAQFSSSLATPVPRSSPGGGKRPVPMPVYRTGSTGATGATGSTGRGGASSQPTTTSTTPSTSSPSAPTTTTTSPPSAPPGGGTSTSPESSPSPSPSAPPATTGTKDPAEQYFSDIETVGPPKPTQYTNLKTGTLESFQPRSQAEVDARNRLGRWRIAAPKRDFHRRGAEATKGASEIATQEILRKTGKTKEQIKALQTGNKKQQDKYQRILAEQQMRMQNLLNPDRPQFKAEDLTKVMEDGKWTGAYSADVASRDQRIFGEKHTERPFKEKKVKKQWDDMTDDEKIQTSRRETKILKDKYGNVVGISRPGGSKYVSDEEIGRDRPDVQKFNKQTATRRWVKAQEEAAEAKRIADAKNKEGRRKSRRVIPKLISKIAGDS